MRNRRARKPSPRLLLAASVAASLIGLLTLSTSLAGPPVEVIASGGPPETVTPGADGTIVDGGIFGEFDGVPDDWDWTFDESGYEGSITLTTETPESSAEYRVVWEYDLSGLSHEPPVAATLTFTIRGAPVQPLPDAEVHVYSFPADLVESPDDFGAEPAVFQGSVTVSPYQEPTVYTLDVGGVVNEALRSGVDKVGFRFQIDPATPHTRNQAFIDALDADPSTKPYITVRSGLVQYEPAGGPADPLNPVPPP